MSLAGIYNVPTSETELAEWAFAHMAHHRDIVRVIYENYAIALPEYILDPFDPTKQTNWNYTHQIMHSQFNAVLGIDGNDLLGVEWEDENKRAAWIFLQAIEHRQAANILGLG